MRSLKVELLGLTIKGAMAFAATFFAVQALTYQPPRAPGVYTDNQRANLNQFIKKYVAPAPRKRRSQWQG